MICKAKQVSKNYLQSSTNQNAGNLRKIYERSVRNKVDLLSASNLLARVLRKGFSVGDCSLFTFLTSKELLQRFEML